MIDDFDCKTACIGPRERARGVAIERRPGVFVDFGLERSLQRLVRIVRAHEIGVPNEKALLIIVGVDEPGGDVVLAAGAHFAGLRVEYVHPQNLDDDLTVRVEIPFDVGLAEYDEEVARARVL